MGSSFGDYPFRVIRNPIFIGTNGTRHPKTVQNAIFTVELFHATVKASKFSFAELIKAQASKNNSVFLIENLA